jgi:hypothetical protein
MSVSDSASSIHRDRRRHVRSHLRDGWPALAVISAIVAGVIWVLPSGSRNPFWETTVWSLLVLASFAGWGSLVRLVIAARTRVDLGLRTVWGAALACFLGGVLMVPAWMTRPTAFILVELGLVMAVVSLARERAAVAHDLRYAVRVARREPALTSLGFVVAGIVAVRYAGAVADWHINPYDDEIAYLSFVRKLSDTGTVLEPFSLRRLSAYGGQTLFLELVSLRAAPSQAHTFDRGIALLMAVLLIISHRARGRRPTLLMLILAVAFLAMNQNGSINTASYFSGVALFIGLFRTLVWADRTGAAPSWRNALPIAMLSAGACTLRQNYLPVPVLVLGLSYATLVFSKGGLHWRARLAEPAWAAGLTFLFLLPWLISSWQSAHTFLFPVVAGYSNPALALQASAWNFIRELAFQTRAILEERQLRSLGLFVVAVALSREMGGRRPLSAIAVGALGGFVALIHGFTQSDPLHIGRYAFGFLMALPIVVLLTIGITRAPAKPSRLYAVAALALFATGYQLILARNALWWDFSVTFENIESLVRSSPRTWETEPPEAAIYTRLQSSIPPGEKLAILTDEPFYFDYRRNPIWNLDMPCFSSMPPGMPCLQGSEPLERYFRGLGVRYMVFVRSQYSRYHYRRDYALDLFVRHDELWRVYSPYLIDFIDSLADLDKRHREVYSERGIAVIDLAEPK